MENPSRSESVAEERFHLPFIDGLRGIAILMVLAVHTMQEVVSVTGVEFRASLIRDFVNSGARGVQLFFIISAFTLFASTRARFNEERRPYLSFYARRAFRILPLWWLAVALYAWRNGNGPGYVLPSVLMVFGFLIHNGRFDVVPYGWSIFVEESFYVFLPFLYRQVTTTVRAAVLFFGLFAAAFLWSRYAAAFGVPDTRDFVFFFPPSQWFCFGLGIFLYHLWDKEAFRRITENPRVARILDLLVLVLMADMLTFNHRTAALALGALFVAATSPHGWTGALTRNRLLMRFGKCCYSIYLAHSAILGLLRPAFSRWLAVLGLESAPGEIAFAAAFPLMAIVSLGVGTLSFQNFEMAFVRLGRKVVARINA